MIYYLNAGAADLEGADNNQIETLIGRMLEASIEGYHKIILSRSVCSWAMNNLDLAGREKAHLSRLKSDFAQIGFLVDEALCLIEVLVGGQPLEETAKHKYQIGHIALLRGNFLSEAELLVEHIENDCDLLDVVFRSAMRSIPIPAYHFRRAHGGGADIVTCFEHLVRDKRVTVCVHDSDRKAPLDTASQTARRLQQESQKQTFVGDVFETRGHEAENTVPLSILNDHRGRICPQYPDFDKLERLMDAQGECESGNCLWLYFDVKKGICAEKVAAIGNDDVSGWISGRYSEDHQGIGGLSIAGFGDGILRQFLNCGAAIRDFVSYMQKEEWQLHFSGFFEEILWYFACDRRRAVV